MGRLFWKFLLFFWLAQVASIIGVSAVFWFENRATDRAMQEIDWSPPASFEVEAAAITLQYGGIDALRHLLSDQIEQPGPDVYAVDQDNHELLNRNVTSRLIQEAQRIHQDERMQRAVKRVEFEGHQLLLFIPRGESNLPPNPSAMHNERYKGLPGEPLPAMPNNVPIKASILRIGNFHMRHIPHEALMTLLVASLIFASLLAWYFAKPIRHLRSAFKEVSQGNLNVEVRPRIGPRRDELADLGRDFDRMVSQLKALVESQQRLLHDVSHEMRSPLARLQMAIGLARQRPERLETSMDRIERESMRIDQLVGELLTLSRLDAGVTESMDEDVYVNELIVNIVNDAHFEAEENNRSVSFIGSNEIVMKGNAELLYRAFENVIRNAVKHTLAQTSVIVALDVDQNAKVFTLSVIDQGPGVPEADLASIFEPFFRSGSAKNSQGYGLGLAIVKRVIKVHHGHLKAINRPSGGLEIQIILPIDWVQST